MAYIEFEVEDYLDEASTESLERELERRNDRSRYEGDFRQWENLADLIAQGQSNEALQLLAEIAPVQINPSLVSLLCTARMAA